MKSAKLKSFTTIASAALVGLVMSAHAAPVAAANGNAAQVFENNCSVKVWYDHKRLVRKNICR